MKRALAEACVDAILAHPLLGIVIGPVLETQRTVLVQAVLKALNDWEAAAARSEEVPDVAP